MTDVVLHPDRDRSVRRRHPWLLSGAVDRVEGEGAPGAEVRALTVTVVDEYGRPVEGLRREDVTLSENGEARDVTSIEPDRRPFSVAVIEDSSVGVVFRPNLSESVARVIFH